MLKTLMNGAAAFAFLGLAACATTPATQSEGPAAVKEEMSAAETERFAQDREAILAMAGDYDVSFDFIETVSLGLGYELKDRKKSGAWEVVRVIEDSGDFISLQHILLVGPKDGKIALKHWRQDWQYEPSRVLTFMGGNAWQSKGVPADVAKGAWSQEVYQVDDSPRYGAVGHWVHENGVSAWQPPAEWRPLPRRDMTTRDDYHAVDAVNRHAITWFGWVHEQDNTKLVLSGDEPSALVREQGINTYKHFDGYDAGIALRQWEATKGYWAAVRAEWEALEETGEPFALTIKGEPEDLYGPILELASEVEEGYTDEAEAIEEAKKVIAKFTTQDLPPLHERLREPKAE
ncbi:DUF6607 family protein [Parvularcula marina]|uniref:DUF6607 family protein n=1 Tax=Parvularcula marina TaxID=2292771 RepID=UPI0035177AB8